MNSLLLGTPRFVLALFGFLIPAMTVAEIDNRSYFAPPAAFYELPEKKNLTVDTTDAFLPTQAPKVASPPFESRFLNAKADLHDISDWGRRMLLITKDADFLIWNASTNRLIARTNETNHQEIALHFSQYLKPKPQLTVEILKRGQSIAVLSGPFDDVLKHATLPLNIKATGTFAKSHAEWIMELTINSQLPDAKFEATLPLLGRTARPLIVDLGINPKAPVSLRLTVDGILDEQLPIQYWGISEAGHSPWWKATLQQAFGPWDDPTQIPRDQVRRQIPVNELVRELLEDEIVRYHKDPFNGNEAPLRTVVKLRALQLREKDWVIYSKDRKVLEIAVAPGELLMTERLFGHIDYAPFSLIDLSFTRVSDAGEVLKEINLTTWEGEKAHLKTDRGYKLTAAAAFETGYKSVHFQSTLSKAGHEEPLWNSTAVVHAGKPLVIMRETNRAKAEWQVSLKIRDSESFR